MEESQMIEQRALWYTWESELKQILSTKLQMCLSLNRHFNLQSEHPCHPRNVPDSRQHGESPRGILSSKVPGCSVYQLHILMFNSPPSITRNLFYLARVSCIGLTPPLSSCCSKPLKSCCYKDFAGTRVSDA